MKIRVKVVPGASRDEVVGWLGDTVKIRVTAPPEHGKANKAVERLLASHLGVPKSAVAIVSGSASSRKVVELRGAPDGRVAQRLGQPESENKNG